MDTVQALKSAPATGKTTCRCSARRTSASATSRHQRQGLKAASSAAASASPTPSSPPFCTASVAARSKMWARRSRGRLAQAAGAGAAAGAVRGGGRAVSASVGPSRRDLLLLRLIGQLSGVLGASKAEDMLVGWAGGHRPGQVCNMS